MMTSCQGLQIVVLVKYVPDTDQIRMDEKTGTMIREGIPGIINPLDLYAVETALRLKDTYGGTITALSMGPLQAKAALQEALAMGVDQAVLLTDPRFAGADTWATAYTLSAAIKRLGCVDLIICGEKATDGETGQVGPEVGALLNIPVVTYVSRIDEVALSGDEKYITCWRIAEDEYQLLKAKLPSLLTVTKEIGEPRIPTFLGKLNARKAPIVQWGLGDLGLAGEEVGLAGSPTRVVKIFYPTLSRKTKYIHTTPELAVQEIISFLRTKGGIL